jgi:helix-turn-helix protein
MALEDDRFEALPGPAYAKGFLRMYADYLGLDAQRFVDEYNARFAPEEPAAAPPIRIRRRRFAFDWRLLALPVAAVLVGLIVWQLSRTGSHHQAALRPRPGPHARRGRHRHPHLRLSSTLRPLLGSCLPPHAVAAGCRCTSGRRRAGRCSSARYSPAKQPASSQGASGSASARPGTSTRG